MTITVIKDTVGLRIRQEIARQRSVRQGCGACLKKMVKRGLALWLIALFLFGAAPGIAGASEVREISLGQAVQLAVRNNQDLKTAKNNVRYSTLTLEKEKNDYLPLVTGSLNTSMMSDYEQPGSERNTYAADAGVAVSLNLFNGFEDDASFEGARQELSAYEYDAARQEQKIIYNTVSAYLNVVKQLREIDVARENLAYHSQKEKEIIAFYDAGKIPVTDLYQQQAETVGAKSDLIAAENTLKVAKLELAYFIGTKDFEGVDVNIPEIDFSAMAGEITINDLIQTAFQTRADLLALEKSVSAKDAGVREAKSGRYPAVDLNAGVTAAYANQYEEISGSYSGHDSLDSYVGLAVSLPVFDKHLTRVRVGQAQIEKQTAVLSLEKLKEQIRVELGAALADYRSACETIRVADSRLFYTEKALASADQRYSVGKSGLTDLLQIRSDMVEAKNNVIAAQIDKTTKIFSILFYSGDLGISHFLREELS